MAKMRTRFTSAADVQALVAQWRNRGCSVTNLYLNASRLEEWCEAQTLYGQTHGETLFLWRNAKGFTPIWFLSQSIAALIQDVRSLLEALGSVHCPTVDLLGMDDVRAPLEEAFISNGFAPAAMLQRMGRRTPSCPQQPADGIIQATEEDLPVVEKALQDHFDAGTDQLPSFVELRQLCTANGIWLKRGSESSLDGMVLFELSKSTLYLRYWWVAPSARGQGIGAALAHTMFSKAAHTKRQMLWVKTDNTTAIERYRHYGFEFEPLKDTVMVRRNNEQQEVSNA